MSAIQRSLLTFGLFLSITVIAQPIAGTAESPGAPHSPARFPQPETSLDRGITLRVDKQLVLVPVTVTTPSGISVTGLGKDDFKLYENGVEQSIENLSSEDVPMSVGIVFDTSGSMQDKLVRSRQALSVFVKAANPEDEFLLVQVNDQAHASVPFTSDVEEITSRLFFEPSKGRTALLDGVYLALNEMRKARNSRRALLIVSDGGDNSSRYALHEVWDFIREADVQIYAMGIYEPPDGRDATPEEFEGPNLLRDLAEQTGGHSFDVENGEEMLAVAAKIGTEMRNHYVIAYSPKNEAHDGKFRKIRVKLADRKEFREITPRCRLGYYAPAD